MQVENVLTEFVKNMLQALLRGTELARKKKVFGIRFLDNYYDVRTWEIVNSMVDLRDVCTLYDPTRVTYYL